MKASKVLNIRGLCPYAEDLVEPDLFIEDKIHSAIIRLMHKRNKESEIVHYIPSDIYNDVLERGLESLGIYIDDRY